MKRPFASIAIAGLFAVIAVTLWMVTDVPAPVSTPAHPGAEAPPAAAPEPAQPVAVAMPEPDLPPPIQRPSVSPEALKEMDDVQFMLRDYRTKLGGNPEGTNAEIMKEISGGNRAQAKFGPLDGQKLNDQGELIDRWGSAYFFHQLSMNQTELRSAGPDRTMWTTDDLVVK
jgi:hypothetical protein